VKHSATSQRGVAIIMAMLVVALATSVAAYAAWQQNLWIRRTENLGNQAQALAVSRAALYFGRLVLVEDLKNSDTATHDHLQENWAKYALVTPVEGGSVSGGIKDQQGLFNVNNLAANTDAQQQSFQLQWFTALLAALDLPTSLADALQDYIDLDDQGPFEDLTYLGKPEPYRTANQPLQSLDELSRIQGFDDAVIRKLKPFITAIPVIVPPAQGASAPTIPVTLLNVNTAPKEVLDAVFGTPAGEQIVALRDKAPFKELAEFETQTSTLLPAADPNNPATHPWSATNIDVKSNYFLVSAVSQFGATQTGLLALILRVNASTWPAIMWQKQTLD
jgi:general secretion pathway protein K